MSTEQLELAADILGPLLPELVFVGGATIHLWVTESTAPPVRATDDVDVICDVTTRTGYYRLGERLRARGLHESRDEPVVCRWRHRDSGMAVDVMPVAEAVLGFTNDWYELAIQTATERKLPSGSVIRAAQPTAVSATKLAAWRGRGGGDMLASLDLHDVMALIDGRPALAGEFAGAEPQIRSFVVRELAALRDMPFYDYLLQSATSGYGTVAPDRTKLLRQRVDALIELRDDDA
jgi:hypothetical protein